MVREPQISRINNDLNWQSNMRNSYELLFRQPVRIEVRNPQHKCRGNQNIYLKVGRKNENWMYLALDTIRSRTSFKKIKNLQRP